MVQRPSDVDDEMSSLHLHRIPLAVALGVVVQTVFVAIWLTNLRSDVNQLIHEHAGIEARIQQIDQNGTRGMETIRNRQSDFIASQTAQDARIREIETKTNEMQRQAIENRVRIDQLTAAVRTFAHPSVLMPQPSTPIPPSFQLQSEPNK